MIIPTKIQCNNKEINNSTNNKLSTNLVDSIMPKIYAKYIPLTKITADNDEPTLKDVMSNLMSVKGLIEGIEKSFGKLELQEVKVTSLEESRSFILNKYEDQQSYLNKFNSYSKWLEKENTLEQNQFVRKKFVIRRIETKPTRTIWEKGSSGN